MHVDLWIEHKYGVCLHQLEVFPQGFGAGLTLFEFGNEWRALTLFSIRGTFSFHNFFNLLLLLNSVNFDAFFSVSLDHLLFLLLLLVVFVPLLHGLFHSLLKLSVLPVFQLVIIFELQLPALDLWVRYFHWKYALEHNKECVAFVPILHYVLWSFEFLVLKYRCQFSKILLSDVIGPFFEKVDIFNQVCQLLNILLASALGVFTQYASHDFEFIFVPHVFEMLFFDQLLGLLIKIGEIQ